MRLVIGGSFQGKLAYTLEQTGLTAADVSEGESCGLEEVLQKPILHHFERLVKRLLSQPDRLEQLLTRLEQENPPVILISDEVGYGVVPVEPAEREFREAVGRACCRLVRRADSVDRICCGLAQRIKGDAGW